LILLAEAAGARSAGIDQRTAAVEERAGETVGLSEIMIESRIELVGVLDNRRGKSE
jgi:hypothetical protein